ncbi:MAG: carboxypeptidase regulatory-like domain-containing protein [candidate division WOR-3 bacterium]
MKTKGTLLVALAAGIAWAYGPSYQTVEGVERVFSATTPGMNGLIINMIRLNITQNNFDTTDWADNGTLLTDFRDARGYGDLWFGLGYSVPWFEVGITGDVKGDAWDKQGERGGHTRDDSYNRSAVPGWGDLGLVIKGCYPLANKQVGIGATYEMTFPTGDKGFEVIDTTDTWGIRQKGGFWRTFTYDDLSFGGRFLLSYMLWREEYMQSLGVHLNLGYNTKSIGDKTDDVFVGGIATMFALGLFKPFIEVYTEQFVRDTASRHGDGPTYGVLGFRLDFGNGLVMDFAGEKMFGDRTTGNQDNLGPNPDFWLPSWKPTWAGWFALNYTYVFTKPEKKPAPGAIAVAVMDDETKKPVGDATVGVPEAGKSPRQVDPATGFIKIDSVPAGQYTVQVTAPGYEAYAGIVAVQAGGLAQMNVFLKRTKPTECVVVGRVVDAETGTPIGNAVITFPQTTGMGVLNVEAAAGSFKAERVPPGTHTVQASAPGYQPGSQMITLKAGESYTVEFRLTKETPNVAVVTGRVYNVKDNTSIANAYITITGGTSQPSPASSGSDGIYRMENIAPGTYTIKCTAPGYKEVSEVINLAKGQVLIKDFPLTPSVTKGMLVVHVVDKKTGNPLPANLTFVGTNLPVATTDPSTGVWQGEVPTGAYTVNAVVTGGLTGYVPAVKTAVVNEGQATELRIEMVKKGITFTFRNIYFKKASAVLLPTAEPALNEILAIMNENPTIKIEIQGHTSTEGTTEYNQKLSQDRANSVRTWLIQRGVSADRLVAVGYGESQPEIYPDNTEPEREQNRRVVIKVIGEIGQ